MRQTAQWLCAFTTLQPDSRLKSCRTGSKSSEKKPRRMLVREFCWITEFLDSDLCDWEQNRFDGAAGSHDERGQRVRWGILNSLLALEWGFRVLFVLLMIRTRDFCLSWQAPRITRELKTFFRKLPRNWPRRNQIRLRNEKQGWSSHRKTMDPQARQRRDAAKGEEKW